MCGCVSLVGVLWFLSGEVVGLCNPYTVCEVENERAIWEMFIFCQ